MKKFIEKKIKTVKKVSGNAVGFQIDQVRLPNGKKGSREFLNHPGAVAIIPVLNKKEVLMVRQYRYPVQEVTWELPAGKLDPRETPLSCAKRELREETGYRAGKLTRLLSLWPTPAFANEIIHVYSAEHLTKGISSPDEDEFIDCRAWPLKKALDAVMKGQLRDSKTMIGLLAYARKAGIR